MSDLNSRYKVKMQMQILDMKRCKFVRMRGRVFVNCRLALSLITSNLLHPLRIMSDHRQSCHVYHLHIVLSMKICFIYYV